MVRSVAGNLPEQVKNNQSVNTAAGNGGQKMSQYSWFTVYVKTIDKERLYGKYYKHKQSIIDFFTGAGTGLVISCCISPDSIRRTVILCIGIAMFFIGGVKKLRWDKDVVK